MYSAIQTGGQLGMQTLDQCLKGLVDKGMITKDAAREKAKIPEDFAQPPHPANRGYLLRAVLQASSQG